MLTLAYAWVLLFLPVPVLVWWLAPGRRMPRPALGVPFLDRLAQATGHSPEAGAPESRANGFLMACMAVAWVCLVAACCRPQWVEPAVTKTVPVRDMLLAVDLSGSMQTKDFTNASGAKVDRLTAVKEVLDDFLKCRQGDRVGLIVFGNAPFVQAPFTQDLAVCRELLKETRVGMAGPQTALGDAVGLAINVFDASQMKERVLIVLTDGNDTASQVPPAKAAQIAHDKGIVIHTIAVGDPKAAGEEKLDEETLKQMAQETGGVYSHANDRGELAAVYGKLDALETQKAQTISRRPKRDVYFWPLGVGLLISMLPYLGQLSPVGRVKELPEPVKEPA